MRPGSKPRCASMDVRSRSGISPSTRCGIPAPDRRLLRIVVVHDPGGRRRDDCFFSTDLTLQPPQILETFALRWPLEVCFRDVKQFLGFEDPQNRVSKATQRTAPLVFYIYDLVLLWHARQGIASRRNQLSNVFGTSANSRFHSKIFFEICGKPPGRKRFSTTLDLMYTREKSFSPS